MLFSRQTFSHQKKSSAHEIDFMDNQPTPAVLLVKLAVVSVKFNQHECLNLPMWSSNKTHLNRTWSCLQ